jgi:hypothetical protein
MSWEVIYTIKDLSVLSNMCIEGLKPFRHYYCIYLSLRILPLFCSYRSYTDISKSSRSLVLPNNLDR